MQELPIGEQDFITLRQKRYVYVDKTDYIHRMMTGSGRFLFLSRPRRFGKSLLLSTMKAMFEGKKELFEGLYIHDKMDWDKKYPVLYLDMSGLAANSIGTFGSGINTYMDELGESLDCTLTAPIASGKLLQLINQVYNKTGNKLVLLVDEYDKPIQDALHKPEVIAFVREILQDFYTVIKKQSEKLHFVLLTGVSKISQVSIFSGLNNLYDISLDPEFAGVCGYTQNELEAGFPEHIEQLAITESSSREALLGKIKDWYNGYSWDGKTFVYNPFSTLLLFKIKKFKPHWFDTATPNFLLELMIKLGDFKPVLEDRLIVKNSFSSSQALEKMDAIALFFQTGYLTIKKEIGDNYELEIPNKEVRDALHNSLFSLITNRPEAETNDQIELFRQGLQEEDLNKAMLSLFLLFSQIDYDNNMRKEGDYHSLLQMVLMVMRIPHQSQVHSSIGRCDLIIRLTHTAYVIELKYASGFDQLDASTELALKQIQDNRYFVSEIQKRRTVWQVGLAFTKGALAYTAEKYAAKGIPPEPRQSGYFGEPIPKKPDTGSKPKIKPKAQSRIGPKPRKSK